MNLLRLIAFGSLLWGPLALLADEPAAELKFADRPLSSWVADLDDSDPLVREEAIEVLGRIGPDAKRSIPKLEKLLATGSELSRRRAAIAIWKIDGRGGPAKELFSANLKPSKGLQRLENVRLLKQLGVPAAELAPYLLDLVVDPDFTVSNPASALFQQFGADGLSTLAAALPKARGEACYRLVNLASSFGTNAKPLIPVLKNLLKDSEPRIRFACVRALWYQNEDRNKLKELVVELAKDKDISIQMEARQFALTVQPKPKEFEAIYQDALKGPNNDIRYRAVQALWELNPKSLKDNLKILTDGVKEVGRNGYWYSAVQTLTAIGPDAKDALPALLAALNDPNGLNNAYILTPAIARMGPQAIEPLVRNLGNTNDQLQQSSRQALQNLGAAAAPKLVPYLSDKDSRIRAEVLTILSSSGAVGTEAIPKLLELLKGEDQTARIRAVDLLGQFGDDAASATPQLTKTLAAAKSVSEQLAIARALGQIGPGATAAAPELKKLLTQTDVSLKFAVAEALLRIDPASKGESSAVLLGLLREKKTVFGIAALPELLLKNGVDAKELMSLLRDYLSVHSSLKPSLLAGLNGTVMPIKESAPLLRELMKDTNPSIRNEAALALARLGDDGKESIPELRMMLKQPNSNWRDRAAIALKKLGPSAKDAAPDLLNMWRTATSTDSQLRLAEPILGIDPKVGKPVMEWLRGQITNANVDQRLQALRILAQYDAKNPDVLKNLLAMARDQQPVYAGLAFEAIGLLGPEAKSALPEVRAGVKDGELAKRVKAAGALWRIEGKADAVLPVLSAALLEQDPIPPGAYFNAVPRGNAGAAAWLLGEMGPAAKPAVPALRQAMRLGDPSLRQNALTAIGKIQKK